MISFDAAHAAVPYPPDRRYRILDMPLDPLPSV